MVELYFSWVLLHLRAQYATDLGPDGCASPAHYMQMVEPYDQHQQIPKHHMRHLQMLRGGPFAGAEGMQYPRAVSAAFQRPTILPAEVACSWKQGRQGENLTFGLPQSRLSFKAAKPTSFVVSSQTSGKSLVAGFLAQGVVDSEKT